MNIRELIIAQAKADLGKREKKGNSGWEDPVFQARMEVAGWELGQSWCSYWAESVWSEAYSKCNSFKIDVVRNLFSGNAVQTWMNFKSSKFETYHRQPNPGDLVIWMNVKNGQPVFVGNSKWIKGHIGIVDQVGELMFTTYEGNSNDDGGREGIEVAAQTRAYDWEKKTGLRLMGFVSPIDC